MESSIQELIRQFVAEYKLDTTIEIRMLDILSEMGELSKEVLNITKYGKKEMVLTDGFQDEFGDVLFSLFCIANALNIDIEQQMQKTLNKYQNRFNEKGRISSN